MVLALGRMAGPTHSSINIILELVRKLLYLHFKDDRCKVSADALQLMVEMLKIFVLEAAARAIRQAQAEDQDKVDIEQFEKVLPQLLLDF
ncbi:centromere protein X isoform X3 [Dromiciops gliroides]|uniref:centromere protein X isoform X3 n=1 Tax=Dromiciops gliroides TaxID=33562 RepID=UPI001CC43313|nr:centromere protein X isoform X3 [Dromiciops gliroides]